MYAVVDIAGQQFKVEEKTQYYVPKLNVEVDKSVTFDNVLLFSDGKKTTIGTPSVSGAKVTVKVVEHLKDDKVIVFKKKRRKSYKLKNGHRQQLSKIEVTKINMTKSSSKVKKEEEKVEESK
ncbi:MAG: 50S ribosomal protein L21 [Ignavibacteriae bacterium]|nr:MAG: 50S ribosomal protein L21 [Ignavibacteriota bacterium]